LSVHRERTYGKNGRPTVENQFYWIDLQKASRDASDEQLAAQISELTLVLKRS
jgi:hypothetical protein